MTAAPTPPPLRTHIDTDPGLDDLLALTFALASPELAVSSLTTVSGNAALEPVTRNARGLLALAGTDIPVGVGASAPLRARAERAEHVHGRDGRGGVPLPPAPEPSAPESAAAVLHRELGECGSARLVALAPLTNVALGLEADPDLLAQTELVWMGGSLDGGNATPLAEFNAYADPHAVRRVLDADASVRVVGLDVTRRVTVHERDLGRCAFGAGARGRFLDAVLRRLMQVERPTLGEPVAVLHDPCAIAAAIDPDLFTWEQKRLTIGVNEDSDRGRLLEEPAAGRGSVLFAVDVRTSDVVRMFLGRLQAWAAEPSLGRNA